jgi:hypothetical protein
MAPLSVRNIRFARDVGANRKCKCLITRRDGGVGRGRAPQPWDRLGVSGLDLIRSILFSCGDSTFDILWMMSVQLSLPH